MCVRAFVYDVSPDLLLCVSAMLLCFNDDDDDDDDDDDVDDDFDLCS